MNTLPVQIYNDITSPRDVVVARAWGAALTLVALVLILNLIARANLAQEPPGMIPPETTSKEPENMPSAPRPIGAGRQRRPISPRWGERAQGPWRQGQGPARLLRRSVHAIKGIDIDFPANEVTAIIGPSGCGKSTMVRCINRMHEEIPGARAEGSVTLDELDVYGDGVDVTAVRRVIGMVFQKPNPFPTMSIFDNVAAGLRLTGTKSDNLRETRPPGAARGRSVGRGQEPPQRARDRPLRRPAAAAVHRPGGGRRARGDPDGRAGARRLTRSPR